MTCLSKIEVLLAPSVAHFCRQVNPFWLWTGSVVTTDWSLVDRRPSPAVVTPERDALREPRVRDFSPRGSWVLLVVLVIG